MSCKTAEMSLYNSLEEMQRSPEVEVFDETSEVDAKLKKQGDNVNRSLEMKWRRQNSECCVPDLQGY